MVTASERIAAPRSSTGVQWRITATHASGQEIWSQAFPAPWSFHVPSGREAEFAVAVPHLEPGARLAVSDESGRTLWTQAVDEQWLERARVSARAIRGDLDLAQAATAKLHENSELRAREWRAGPRWLDTSRKAPFRRAPSQPPQAPAEEPASIAAPKGAAPTYHVGGSTSTNIYEVRVYDADTGAFVVSTRADWRTGRYEFLLPRGRYEFEFDDNIVSVDGSYFYRRPWRSVPVSVSSDTQVPSTAPSDDAGWFEFVAEHPCSLALAAPGFDVAVPYSLAVELRTEDGVRIYRDLPSGAQGIVVVPPGPTSSSEYCSTTYRITLTPGTYAFELSFPGWQPLKNVMATVATGGTTTFRHRFPLADRTLVWRGSIFDAHGDPLSNYFITAVNRLNDAVYWGFSTVADDGHFEIPYSPGWAIDFEPSDLSTGQVRQRFMMNGQPLPKTVTLDEVAADNTLERGLMRIHGDGELERHYNILFLAEGYSGTNETFTDTNGNGTWDGFYWTDRNGDGIYNDDSRIVGFPDLGLLDTPDPLSGNEPFADLNADGVLNRDEAAEFEQNARDFMRALLGADFWNQHRHAFNAYLLFEPSAQAGFDITQEDGRRTQERDTRYGANLVMPRGIVEIDRAPALQRALSALPEVDMVVVLVNQPVHVYARGNVSMAQPGSMVWPSGAGERWNLDTGPSHEMGHYAATLCDEYTEFFEVSPAHGQDQTWCPNVSHVADPGLVPWALWLAPNEQVPDIGLGRGVGIFAGADYYAGGAYRPTYNSTMRNNSPFFNAPSRAALERAMYERTGDPAVLQTRPQPQPVSRIRKPHPL